MSRVAKASDAMRPSSHLAGWSLELQSTPSTPAALLNGPASPSAGPQKEYTPHSMLLMLLSFIALVIVVINFMQLGLLRYIESPIWINVPPALLLASVGVLVGLYLADPGRRSDARRSWKQAPYENRLARVGAILTILAVIIACQFIYMNITAIPRYNSTSWKTEFVYEDTKAVPALLIVSYSAAPQMAKISGDVRCEREDITSEQKIPCHDFVHYHDTGHTNIVGDFQYILFTPDRMNLTGINFVSVLYNITYKSNARSIHFSIRWDALNMIIGFANETESEPFLFFTFIDPQLTMDGQIPQELLEALMDGDCSAWQYQLIPVPGTNLFSVSRTDIQDEIGALDNLQDCGIDDVRSKGFSLYDVSHTKLSYNDRANLTWCDQSWELYNGWVCGCEARIYLDSQVTRRISHRGTDAITILVEESGIAGGVMFFTWFLGLYVL